LHGAQFVLFLAYMPIISSSLRVLDCTQPIDGVRYLRTDLRVPCGVGEHAVATAIAYIVLVGLGLGFPGLLTWLLATASAHAIESPAFQGAWGFLYHGYRASGDDGAGGSERSASALQQSRPHGGSVLGWLVNRRTPLAATPPAEPTPTTHQQQQRSLCLLLAREARRGRSC